MNRKSGQLTIQQKVNKIWLTTQNYVVLLRKLKYTMCIIYIVDNAWKNCWLQKVFFYYIKHNETFMAWLVFSLVQCFHPPQCFKITTWPSCRLSFIRSTFIDLSLLHEYINSMNLIYTTNPRIPRKATEKCYWYQCS